MLHFFWGILAEMCWLWSNRKSVMWGAIEDVSAGSKAPCQAQHSQICQCSASSSRCVAGVESSSVGTLSSHTQSAGKPRVHPLNAGKSPVLTLTSKSAYLLQKAHAQGGRNSHACRRYAGHEWGVTEGVAFILSWEDCIFSMSIIYWAHKPHPKFYINSPHRNLSCWVWAHFLKTA